jgi:hypothetical protein
MRGDGLVSMGSEKRQKADWRWSPKTGVSMNLRAEWAQCILPAGMAKSCV